MFTFAGTVAHNLSGADWLFYLSSCQIQADDNSSTCVFIDGTSVTIVLARFNYISHIY